MGFGFICGIPAQPWSRGMSRVGTYPARMCPAMRQRADAAGAEFIRLESFLKLQGLAETGGQAKLIIASGAVSVNGHVDTRRGRKLRQGDIVSLDDISIPVDFTADEDEEAQTLE